MSESKIVNCRLPAEWEEQAAVLLVWPHERTDWVEHLLQVQQVFIEIIRTICLFETVLLVVSEQNEVKQRLAKAGINLEKVSLYELPYDDTWPRDFGPLCIQTDKGPLLLNFIFNGWGNKFSAQLDNRLTQGLANAGAFSHTPLRSIDLVLEGGSIESDGAGTLLTTSRCLLEKNRNPSLSKELLEAKLIRLFGAKQVLWLEHGALQGDDTDSHIDTLARFAPEKTLLFQGCNDPKDTHYLEFAAMHRELSTFSTPTGQPYRLLELPWPQACLDQANERLPASYANFLIINEAVLVPTYNDPADQKALEIIELAFPQRKIVPIDCRTLILQHGSLHCVTMQLPKGVVTIQHDDFATPISRDV